MMASSLCFKLTAFPGTMYGTYILYAVVKLAAETICSQVRCSFVSGIVYAWYIEYIECIIYYYYFVL